MLLDRLRGYALTQCFHAGSDHRADSLIQAVSKSRSAHNYRRASIYVKGRQVLDVGAGNGVGYDHLLRGTPRQVTSLDLKQTTLPEYFHRNGMVRFVQEDFLTVEFKESFDVILMFGVLYWFRDPVAACGKACELLRDGGVFLFNYPSQQFVRTVFGCSSWKQQNAAISLVDMEKLDSRLGSIFKYHARREGQAPFLPKALGKLNQSLSASLPISLAPRPIPPEVVPFYEFRAYQKCPG